MSDLILKPAHIAAPDIRSGRDDFAVLHDGKIVGRIMKESFAGYEERWKWSFKRASGKGYEMGQTDSRGEVMGHFGKRGMREEPNTNLRVRSAARTNNWRASIPVPGYCKLGA